MEATQKKWLLTYILPAEVPYQSSLDRAKRVIHPKGLNSKGLNSKGLDRKRLELKRIQTKKIIKYH